MKRKVPDSTAAPVLDHFRKFTLPSETPRLQNWWSAVRARSSVRTVENPASYYIDRFTKILVNPSQSSDSALKGKKW